MLILGECRLKFAAMVFIIIGSLPTSGNVVDNYIEWGIIREDEKNGGIVNLFALGLVYDTRNDLCYCTDGSWAEAV